MLHGYEEAAARGSATATSRFSTRLVFERHNIPVPPDFPICIPPERKDLATRECAGEGVRVPDDIYTLWLPPCDQARLPECTADHLFITTEGSAAQLDSQPSSALRLTLWVAAAAAAAAGAAWMLTRSR